MYMNMQAFFESQSYLIFTSRTCSFMESIPMWSHTTESSCLSRKPVAPTFTSFQIARNWSSSLGDSYPDNKKQCNFHLPSIRTLIVYKTMYYIKHYTVTYVVTVKGQRTKVKSLPILGNRLELKFRIYILVHVTSLFLQTCQPTVLPLVKTWPT